MAAELQKISILGKDSIHLGYGIEDHIAQEVCEHLPSSQYVLISDTNIDQFDYCKRLMKSLKAQLEQNKRDSKISKYLLQPGEASKTRETKAQIEDFMLTQKCTRDTVILAIGGGVIGDMVGFVASTFMRGVRFVQIPTSLLAMVDSSIGGKTGVDTPAGKNLIGAFWQPERVFIDLCFLESLPEREFINGMAEVIKTAAIWDHTAFSQLESYNEPFFDALSKRDETTKCIDVKSIKHMLMDIVSGSVKVKAEVVTADEKEGGLRNLLNFGHSIGHAYEAIFMPNILHGECVSIGMVLEAELSRHLGILSPANVARLVSCLSAYKLPISPKDSIVLKRTSNKRYTVDQLISIMGLDKKNDGAKKKIVLLSEIGNTYEKKASVVADSSIRFVLSDDVQLGDLSQSPENIVVIPPGSKSLSNRALILAALGQGKCRIRNLLHSDDTGYMIKALESLSKKKIVIDGEDVIIEGTGGQLTCPSESLYLGNAGTAARFITSLAALVQGQSDGQKLVLTGNARMQERPIGALVDALVANGMSVEYMNRSGSLPLSVTCKTVAQLEGGVIELSASISSQYVSSILMCAPYARKAVTLVLKGKPISELYIDMTIALMQQFGIEVEKRPNFTYYIPQGIYKNPAEFVVESDASSATYPLALAAIAGPKMTVTVPTIGSSSLQGDARFAVDVLQAMGCDVAQTATSTTVKGCSNLKGITVDMEPMTDAFLTAAVVAAVAQGTTVITGIANQRVKECNRIAAMVKELGKFGVSSSELEDGITIHGMERSRLNNGVRVYTYDDHRVAMCFSLLSILTKSVVQDRRCTSKTWPGWWDVLQQKFQVSCTGIDEQAAPVEQDTSAHSDVTSELNSVFVIGMRGAGKTSISQVIASVMGLQFLDLDDHLESTQGRSIPQIIEAHGWEGFRQKELELFAEVQKSHAKGYIIACGGGLVETPAARDLLKDYMARPGCIVLHVHRDVDDIIKYLQEDKSRPAYTNDIKAVWNKREEWYHECSNKLFISPSVDMEARASRSQLQCVVQRFMERATGQSSVTIPTSRSYFVSLTSASYSDVDAKELRAIASGCAAVELRVDHLQSLDLQFVADQIATLRHKLQSTPIIFTIRTTEQCGKFDSTQHKKAFELLQLALKMEVEYVDLETTWPSYLVENIVNNRGATRIIASDHSAVSIPWSNGRWEASYKAAARFGDIVKLVNTAATPQDNVHLEVFREAHQDKPLIALNMGEAGKLSRVLNPILTPITHELVTQKAAPGQLTIKQINQILTELGQLAPRKFFICGTPISHSPSPDLHNTGFQAVGLPYSYGRLETSEAQDVRERITNLGANFGGCSVTIPLKVDVISFLDRLCSEASEIKAVNTIVREASGKLVGYNTDWMGIVKALEVGGVYSLKTACQKKSSTALVIGAGGTARAAIYAYHRLGFENILIVNRTHSKAEDLANEYAKYGVKALPLSGVSSLEANIVSAVSCIPANLPLHDELREALSSIFSKAVGAQKPATILDVAYKPELTAVMELAQQHGWCAVPGKEMLYYQGVEQFKLWTGLEAPPSMRGALA